MRWRRISRELCDFRHLAAKRQGHAGWQAVAVLLCGLLAGCATDGATGNPLTQRFVWFRYLNGDDIRQNCFPGSPSRTRLVYNGRYQEQLRRYEVIANGAGGALLDSRAQGRASLTRVTLNDVMAPWRWQQAEIRLSPQEVTEFEAALQRSRLLRPATRGSAVALRRFLLDRRRLPGGKAVLQCLAPPLGGVFGARVPGLPLRARWHWRRGQSAAPDRCRRAYLSGYPAGGHGSAEEFLVDRWRRRSARHSWNAKDSCRTAAKLRAQVARAIWAAFDGEAVL